MDTPFKQHDPRDDAQEVDLTEKIKHEDVKTARHFLLNLDKEVAILLAAEVLVEHAIEEDTDFGVIVQVDPRKLKTLEHKVEFEIKTKMLIDGKG